MHVEKEMPTKGTTGQSIVHELRPHNESAVTLDNLFGELIVNSDDIKEIKDAEFIIDDMVIKSHVAVLIAEPGCGKTALLMHLAPIMVGQGYKVLYFNLDASAPEIARHYKIAQNDGYTLIAPDIKVGCSVDDAVSALSRLDEVDDISNLFLMLDTLKKFVDVIHKGQSKQFFKLLRKLSGKGATILMAGHANKHRSPDGELIYEGTGDLRADVDELIYLEYQKGIETQTITTYVDPPAKVRGAFKQLSFQLNLGSREMYQLAEVVDVKEGNIAAIGAKAADPHGDIKDTITKVINNGSRNQSQIVDACMGEGISRSKVLKALHTGSDPVNPLRYLRVIKGAKNANKYHLFFHDQG